MSQFASTLYPQTNPTNPLLLSFREYAAKHESSVELAAHWTKSEFMWSEMVLSDNLWTPDEHIGSPSQEEHAYKVLTRLAKLSG